MLRSTFCCFRGIDQAKEQRLWERGILRWDDVAAGGDSRFGAVALRSLRPQIGEASRALEHHIPDYFLRRLDGLSRLRLLHDFRGDTVYLDIETTGLAPAAEITIITVYNGRRVNVYVSGSNLDEFLSEVAEIGVMVTYNGTRFDLPRLRKRFGIDLAMPHLDLCPILQMIGYYGDLKACERLLGIARPPEMTVDGAEAVRLWEEYSHGHDRAILIRLIWYAALDVVNLERICGILYRKSMAQFPIDIPFPSPERIPVYWGNELIFDNCITIQNV